MAVRVQQHKPYTPIKPSKSEAHAIRALQAGNATQDQQQTALRFIIEDMCETYRPSYVPEAPQDTAFAEGKRHIGLQIVNILNLPRDSTLLKSSSEPTEQG